MSDYYFIKNRPYDGTNRYRFEDKIIKYLMDFGYDKEYIIHMDITSDLTIPSYELNRLIVLLITYLKQNIVNNNKYKFIFQGLWYKLSINIIN